MTQRILAWFGTASEPHEFDNVTTVAGAVVFSKAIAASTFVPTFDDPTMRPQPTPRVETWRVPADLMVRWITFDEQTGNR